MLDADTKRRIDSCRDMLVGKLPDPKSQVEQITIALIYKFMDDMDAEAEELGGKRSFFAGEYGKYGWSKLMAPSMGGYDVLNLYSEAITKMNENPGVPPLFRDIFKNAYLPYRDPETLRAFLKEIHCFHYDHSERLGDAFEYLLSVLGSQGEAGQFRTPRHIIDFIVDVVAPRKNETILDPACGTAGFLISSYKHILQSNKTTPLTAEERTRLAQNLTGYDISPDMVRLSLVNLYLHGFLQPQIEEYDTLTSEEKWNEHADVILANPPFMSPKGGIKPHRRFSVQSNRSEVLFVDYIAEHLTPNGRAGVIVPEGIIFQSGGAYKTLREMLVKNYLIAVVSLPAGVFQPYSGVKTSILILDRKLAKQTDSLLFVKVESDGFGLGAQRRAIGKNDLPDAARHLKAWQESLQNRTLFLAESQPNVHLVEKARIAESGDYNLSSDRYLDSRVVGAYTFPMVRLDEICERVADTINPSEYAGETNYIGLENIEVGTGILTGNIIASYEDIKSAKTRFSAGHILYGKLRPNLNKVYLSKQSGICSTDIFVLKSKENADAKFVSEMLRSPVFNTEVLKGLGGAQLPRVSYEYLAGLKIPLPPLDVQKEIAAEIEGYQKVIDGARQVVENYKPRIPIHPDWPMVELGSIASTASGGTPSKSEDEYWKGNIPWVSPKDMKVNFIEDTEDHISDAAVSSSATKMVDPNTLLCVVRSGILQHTFPIAITTRKMCFNQDIIAISPSASCLDIRYLFYFFKSYGPNILNLGIKPGVTVQSFHSGFFKSYKLPLPDLETQKAIVAEIEEEQRLVNANKDLIRMFEAKIKTAIDRVWGEAE